MRSPIILFLLFTFSFVSFGAYLENVPTQLVQPNGEVLDLFITGDEFFSRVHDSEGYSIVQGDNGWYYFAMYDTENDELVPSEYVVSASRNFELPMAKELGISHEKYMEIRRLWHEPGNCYPSGAARNPILQNIDYTKATQTVNNIVICIGFSDTPGMSNTHSVVNGMLNTNTNNNVSHYFTSMSYDKLDVASHFYPPANGTILRYYQDPNPRGYYMPYNASSNTIGYSGGDNGTQRTQREQTMLRNAILWVNDNWPVSTSLNLDIDGDGYVDYITFVVFGEVGAWSSLLWPHKWQLHSVPAVYINGKRAYVYNFMLDGSSQYFNVNVFCHEGYHVLGAPDLYHYNSPHNAIQTVGSWDLMEYNYLEKPQSMSAYMKFRYGGWTAAPQLAAINQTYEIFPFYNYDGFDPAKKVLYRIPMTGTTTQYSAIEYRKKNGTNYDLYLPNDGLLIYRINSSMNGNAQFNGTSTFDEVYLYRPGSSQTTGIYTQGNLIQAPFGSSTGRTSFNNTTDPKPCLSNGTAENTQNINNILYDNETDSYTFFYGNPANRSIFLDKTDLQLENISGSTGTVTITSNVLWRITIPSSATGWLSVSKTKGLNSDMVTFSTISNNTGASRTATVAFTGNGQTFNVNVTQAGLPGDYIFVNVSANPSYGGTVSGGGTYSIGTPVIVTATPNSDYGFVNWTVNGAQINTNQSFSFSATENISLVANFALIGYVIFFEDNFDEYVAGQPLVGQGKPPWRTWDQPMPADQNPMVTAAQASTYPNSVFIQNNNDLLFPFNNLTTGRYIIEFDYYIPSNGNGAYFNIQHFNTPGVEWACEAYFHNNATGYLNVGGNSINFTCKTNQWFHIFIDINLDDDLAILEIDGNAVHSWLFHYTNGGVTGTKQLGGVNIFAGSATPNPSNPSQTLPGAYYIDNFKIVANTEPEECNPVTNLAVDYAPNCLSAQISWNTPTGASTNIYRDDLLIKANHTTTSYIDTEFNPTVSHTWSVAVVCSGGMSDQVSITKDACDPVIPVTDIINVPATATIDAPLSLTGTVVPNNASNQTIVWSIQNAGVTGATITGNIFNATATGTATVLATINNGIEIGSHFTKPFTISVGKAPQTAPDAPELLSKTASSITLVTMTDCEYNIDGGTWQDSGTFEGLTPNTPYSFTARKAGTDTHEASPASPSAQFTTDKAALTGTVTITGSTVFGETLTANTTLSSTPLTSLGTINYQWRRGATNIGTNSSTYTLEAGDINSTITVTVTAANCDGNITSAPTVTITKAPQTAPDAPELLSKTASSITLVTITGCEYSENGGSTWQESTTFSGLTPNTSYSFTARKIETATHEASPESPATQITTDKAALTGSVTITGNTVFGETLTANTALSSTPLTSLGTINYQWRRGATNIGTNNSTYTLEAGDINSTITVTVTVANCDGDITSTPTVTITKAPQTAPDAPTAANITSTYITLVIITGCEYRMNSGDWQTSAAFMGLTPNTSYSFTARKTETDTHLDSPESQEATFTTGPIGITDNELEKIKVFSNQFSVYIRNESAIPLKAVEIYDMTGRFAHYEDITGSEAVIPLNVASGIYTVRVISQNEKIVTAKVLITK